MTTLTIVSQTDPTVSCVLRRDVTHVHPHWVHEQIGTESESEIQSYLDSIDDGQYLRAALAGQGPDGLGISVKGPVYTIGSSSGDQAEMLGEGYGFMTDDYDAAREMADMLQASLEDYEDVPQDTVYSVRIGGRSVYLAA